MSGLVLLLMLLQDRQAALAHLPSLAVAKQQRDFAQDRWWWLLRHSCNASEPRIGEQYVRYEYWSRIVRMREKVDSPLPSIRSEGFAEAAMMFGSRWWERDVEFLPPYVDLDP